MRRFLLPLVAVVAASSLALSACGASAAAAAKVNNDTITQSSLDSELRAIQKNKDYLQAIQSQGAPPIEGTGKGSFNTEFVAEILNQRILLTVVQQELNKRHIKITPEDLRIGAAEVKSNFSTGQGSKSLADSFPKSYRDDLARRAVQVELLEAALAGVKLDNATVQKYYDDHKDEFAQTCVRHILVPSKDKADALRARIVGGEDFAAVAKAESTDTGSGAQGGDVGCNLSQFVPEFSQAAQKLAVNEISQPVQTQFGFHLIQVTSRTQKLLDDSVRAQIRQTLVAPGNTKLRDLVYGALNKAKVTVSPQIGKFQKGNADTGEPPHVVANTPAATTTTTVKGSGATSPTSTGGTTSGGSANTTSSTKP